MDKVWMDGQSLNGWTKYELMDKVWMDGQSMNGWTKYEWMDKVWMDGQSIKTKLNKQSNATIIPNSKFSTVLFQSVQCSNCVLKVFPRGISWNPSNLFSSKNMFRLLNRLWLHFWTKFIKIPDKMKSRVIYFSRQLVYKTR